MAVDRPERAYGVVIPDSAVASRLKWGTKRTRQVTMKKGTVVEDDAGTVTLSEDCVMDVEETWLPDPTYSAIKVDGAWRDTKRLWSTLRPSTPSPETVAEEFAVKLSWYRRLFGPRIPRASVVKR